MHTYRNAHAHTHTHTPDGEQTNGEAGCSLAGSGRVWTWRLKPHPLPGSKETKSLPSGGNWVCFEGVFSNPGLYCTVVQLEVKQLFYCHCKSHIKVTMRPSMKHKQILNSEKRKKNKITDKTPQKKNRLRKRKQQIPAVYKRSRRSARNKHTQ